MKNRKFLVVLAFLVGMQSCGYRGKNPPILQPQQQPAPQPTPAAQTYPYRCDITGSDLAFDLRTADAVAAKAATPTPSPRPSAKPAERYSFCVDSNLTQLTKQNLPVIENAAGERMVINTLTMKLTGAGSTGSKDKKSLRAEAIIDTYDSNGNVADQGVHRMQPEGASGTRRTVFVSGVNSTLVSLVSCTAVEDCKH